jgi:hypothetical protein
MNGLNPLLSQPASIFVSHSVNSQAFCGYPIWLRSRASALIK